MTTAIIKKSAFVFLVATVAAGFTSCKGRTTDTVVPDGDTVEVIIPAWNEGDTDSTDSITLSDPVVTAEE